jgi:hypothetical protein
MRPLSRSLAGTVLYGDPQHQSCRTAESRWRNVDVATRSPIDTLVRLVAADSDQNSAQCSEQFMGFDKGLSIVHRRSAGLGNASAIVPCHWERNPPWRPAGLLEDPAMPVDLGNQ